MRTPIARPNSRERLTHLAAILQPSRRAVLICMRRASVHSASCTSGTPARRVMDGNSAESLPCPRTPLAPRHTAAHLAERRLPSVGLCLLLLVTSRAQSEARPGSRGVTDLEHYYQTHRRRHGGPCSASDQQRAPRHLHSARCHAVQCACLWCDGLCAVPDSERRLGEA